MHCTVGARSQASCLKHRHPLEFPKPTPVTEFSSLVVVVTACGATLHGTLQVYERGSRLLRRRTQHMAVQGAWLAIPPGQCFALLGPNGAGKTTTISCLTGLVSPTAGDALVAGHSISTPGGVDRARASLGVCFQFDVLWPKLTGREHMELMAAMRGLGRRARQEQVEELLKQVGRLSAGCVKPNDMNALHHQLPLCLPGSSPYCDHHSDLPPMRQNKSLPVNWQWVEEAGDEYARCKAWTNKFTLYRLKKKTSSPSHGAADGRSSQ